jgi:Zn-dependent protease with chaperone function
MISIHGKWYDGCSSAQKAAVLTVRDSGTVMVVRADDGGVLYHQNHLTRFNARISDRLADTSRMLTFPDGGVFETDDNEAVDRLLARIGRRHWSGWVHLLESKMRYVLLAAVGCLVLGTLAVKLGVPAAAKLIAAQLPPSVYAAADRQVLSQLDRFAFKASEMPPEVEARVRDHMQGIIDDHAGLGITLLFRKGGVVGPNAVALPGGTIIFTDEMIAVAEHDDELLSIMAHEVGHIYHQHSMRRIVQDSLLSFAILALTGDASGVSELFLGLPVVLTELAYSRGFEREADRYALDYLLANGIAPNRFADLLARIDKRGAERALAGGPSWRGYLATHPPTPERIRIFMDATGGDLISVDHAKKSGTDD